MYNAENLYRKIDSYKTDLANMADDIFDHPELPYEEYRSCELICSWLEKEGFTMERKAGGMDTAFRAVYEKGDKGPAIGFVLEYDCLPNGHSCGHHMQGPAILGAVKALKNSGPGRPFKLVVYGTPAEEVLTGKPRMIQAGCFQDIETALMMHAHTNSYVGTKSMTGVNLETVFTGVHAHDTARPWGSRSGFDAMMQAIQAFEYLRGHVHDGTRFFYQISDAIGLKGNTDPSRAAATFSFRTYKMEDLQDLEERSRNILKGAALMNGVKVEIEKTLEVQGTLPNETIKSIMMHYAQEAGAIRLLPEHKAAGGSNDFGNITQIMPAAQFFTAMAPDGIALHTEAILKEGKTEQAHEAVAVAAKVVAATAAELIENPRHLEQAKAEFTEKKEELNRKKEALKI
ncbi:MAG: amidohydrolase [Peptococcaceae bacterium]|nr:amidohydrolase [Peptococcaceae bacterium]